MDEKRKNELFRRAARLALKARPSPNPRVGAVFARGGRIIGEGFHARAGEDHAEIAALKAAGAGARGSDLVVTLEPCPAWGRTPPCADALIAAGVRRVYVGCLDPNPAVAGGGIKRLRDAGIEVRLEEAQGAAGRLCGALIEEWRAFITTGLPFVRIKAAISLDGKMAAAGGDSQWISCAASRRRAHGMRARHDAVMVGIGTVLRDDPLLTVRDFPWKGPPPARIIVDTHLRTPPSSRLVATCREAPTLIAYGDGNGRELERKGVELIRCAVDGKTGRVDLKRLLEKLARRSLTSILVEGGSALITSLVEQSLADALTLFIAPLLVGGRSAVPLLAGRDIARISDAARLEDVRVRRSGDDVMLEGRLVAAKK